MNKNKLFSFNHSFFKLVGGVSLALLLILFVSCGNAFNFKHSKSGSADVSLTIPSEILKSIAARDAAAEQALAENQAVSVEVYFYVDKEPPVKKTREVFDKENGETFDFPEIPFGAKVQATASIRIGNKEYTGNSKQVEVVDEETDLILILTFSKEYLELDIEEAIEQVENVRINSNLKITGSVTNQQVEKLIDSIDKIAGPVVLDLDLSETTGLTRLTSGSSHVQAYSLPDSLEYISGEVLAYSGWIKDISFPNGNSNFIIDNNVLFNKDKTVLIRVITSKLFAEEYTIPSSVKKIETAAFYNCWLNTINIPSSVEEIGLRAFDSSYELKAIKVDSVSKFYKTVDDVLFTADGKELIQFPLQKNMEAYSIPEGTETIAAYAFADNSLLKTLTIPSSLVRIGNSAFNYSKIETIIFDNPNGWYDTNGNPVDPSVLQDTNNLTSNASDTSLVWEKLSKMITIPVTSDDLYEAINSFSGGNHVLYEVTGTITEDELHDIRELIFSKINNDWNWRSYVSLDLRKTSGLTEIYYDLTVPTLGIPASVTTIADFALYHIQNILLSEESTAFTLEDDILYTAGKKHLIWYSPNKQDKEFAIPSSVTTTGMWAFHENSYIEKITIPQGLVQLGETNTRNSCGIDCENLKTIVVEEGNNNYIVVDGVLFTKDKTALVLYPPEKQDTTYTIPSGTDLICWGAIDNNKYLKQITIPESVTKIGGSTFIDCQSLETIIFKDTDNWSIDTNGPDRQAVTAEQLQDPANYRSKYDNGTALFINHTLLKEDDESSQTNPPLEIAEDAKCLMYYDDIFLGGGKDNSYNYSDMLQMLAMFECDQTDYTVTASSQNSSIIAVITLNDSGLDKMFNKMSQMQDPGDTPVTIVAIAAFDNQQITFLPEDTIEELQNALEDNEYSITNNGRVVRLTLSGFRKMMSDTYSASSALLIIPHLSENETLAIKDRIDEYDFKQLGDALRNLDSSVTINLDLSNANFDTVPADTFYNIWALKYVKLPSTTTEIDNNAFSGCYNLVGIDLPENLTRIGSDSFCNCSRLISINIPASVTRIEKDAFKNSNIGTITFANKENWYYMENGNKTYLTESDLATSNFTGQDTLPSIYRIN